METLKRDWSSTLKLRDVLVTISCLLIQPNPASALNEVAGKLASEDWDGYCRRAKLMTEIHAAIPSIMIDEVREAQMRGEDKEEKIEDKAVKSDSNGKGKDRETAKVTPAAPKVHQNLVAEDEENSRRRGDTVELESDPESDWIPGTVKSPNKAFAPARDNIFGIKGLEHGMQVDTPPKKIISVGSKVAEQDEAEDNDDSDPFITVPSKRNPQQSFSLRVPQALPSKSDEDVSTATPDLLKFSHQNPFAAIQPNNQMHPLLKEFSWSWQDSMILHDTSFCKDGPSKTEVRKRMAGAEFKEKEAWERKKFKQAGYDLAKYNRGEFGPRTGIFRL